MIAKQKALLFLFPVLLLLTACFHRMAPKTSGGTSQQTAQAMVYTVAPYGSVSLPGKWEAGKYLPSSMQQYFYRADTTTMIVTVNACRNYPFVKGGPEGFDFGKRDYEAETKYQTQLLEQKTVVLEENKENRYILWMVHADGVDQYTICGVKDCACNECTYRALTIKNRRLSREQCVRELKEILMSDK